MILDHPDWVPSQIADRFQDQVPVLGPWPDDWTPKASGQAGLPTVDIVLGDVIDPGHPYATGPELGPVPPVELLGPSPVAPPSSPSEPHEPAEASPAPTSVDARPVPPSALSPGQPLLDLTEAAAVPQQPGSQQSVSQQSASQQSASQQSEAHEKLSDHLNRQSFAEDFLPPPPRSGGHRAAVFFILAIISLVASAITERLHGRVRRSGALPRLLSALTGIGRGVTILFALIAALSLLPRGWGLAVPFALVALAFAIGWSARDLMADLFAGMVLTIENRINPGKRLEIGPHRGVVYRLGLRATRITVDDGRMVSIPNHQIMTQTLRVDPDSYAPVLVPVPVHPHLSVGQVRQRLEELSLLSPYIAPSRAPNVYRDADRPDVWIVEARLVHPRYANAFRGSLVELADQQLNAPAEPPPPKDPS
ncbi:MAG: mechanosensitive ion channel [Oligoflexia bacterium]|nr:mechanosensitive ion channel [Oligoflexia bacterium]